MTKSVKRSYHMLIQDNSTLQSYADFCPPQDGEGHSKKGHGVFCERRLVKYAWIKEHAEQWPIGLLCKKLGVSRNSYYC